MSRLSPMPGVAAIALAALVLSGCASGSDNTDLDPQESPLSEYLSVLYGGFDEEDYAQQQMESEELVAACMADEGFEYIPVDQSQFTTVSPDDVVDQNTEEWVAANGYGFTQTPEQIEEQQGQAQEFVDPNQSYVQSLSAGEQTAYYETLHGVPPTEDELGEDGSYEYNWETAGCYGAAQHEIQGEQPYDNEANQPLFDAMNEMYEKIQGDPAIAELDVAWASCMADAGYSEMKTKQDAMNVVIEEMNGFYDESGTQPTDEQLAAARDNEIDIALADFRCAEEIDYHNVMMRIQFDLERQFIEDHKSELDALVAEAEQGN